MLGGGALDIVLTRGRRGLNFEYHGLFCDEGDVGDDCKDPGSDRIL